MNQEKHVQGPAGPRTIRQALTALLCLGALLPMAGAARAQAEGFQLAFDFPAGVACSFALRVESRGGPNFYKEFRDKSGTLVRVMSAGANIDYRLTNMSNQAQYLINGRGTMMKTEIAADGTSTTALHGHSVLVLYPSDVPAGPSTTEYVGKVSYASDAAGNFTLQDSSGRQSDLCARLASPD